MTERQIQDGLCAYLRKNRLSFVRNRMDKKSCIREGWPDVTVVHCGRAWLCELKTPTGKLSAKQNEVIAELRANGTPVTVARSVEEAVSAVKTWLGVVNAAGEAPERETGHPKTQTDGWVEVIRRGRNRQAASVPERPKSDEATGVSCLNPNLFIAILHGKDCVFERHGINAGKLVRTATLADLINLPRR